MGAPGSGFIDWLRQSAHFQSEIFWGLRWPRTLSALCVGGALGYAGLLLQHFYKNPLAEPYTLGLSGGATLGAVSFIYLGGVWSLLEDLYGVLFGGPFWVVLWWPSDSLGGNSLLAFHALPYFVWCDVVFLLRLFGYTAVYRTDPNADANRFFFG